LLTRNVISGFVFNDLNNNGLMDPGEHGIAGITIELRNSANVVIGRVVTDANGYYFFNRDSTIDTHPTTLTRQVGVPTTTTDWDRTLFVQQFDPSLGMLTSIDVINTGTISSRILVQNRDPDNWNTITATVSGMVTVSRDGLPPLVARSSQSQDFYAGPYPGYDTWNGPSGHDFGWQTVMGSDSLTITTSSLLSQFIGSGSVSFRAVASALSTARGSGNIRSQIDTNASVDLRVVYHYIPSDAIRPGVYTIVETNQPPGYLDGKLSRNGVVIPNSVGSHSIQVTLAGADLPNNDFAHLLPSSLAGFVYIDANNNGIREPGEPPLAGVTVTLTGSNDLGDVNATTTTGADGSYQFGTLRPGIYTLIETEPGGFLRGRNAAGSLGGTVGVDRLSNITIGTSANGVNYNFAELVPASLSGFVYMDADNNGVREAGEPVLGGVTVTLTGRNDQGDVRLTTTTAADGSYQFRGLRPGVYTLTETEPAGYLRGRNAVGSAGGTLGGNDLSQITLNMGVNGTEYDFAELLPASLAGFVYVDADNNGLRRSGEQGVGGVTITLTGRNDQGNCVMTTTSGADGSYQFRTLRPGVYTLTETEPSSYLRGKTTAGSLGGTAGSSDISAISVAVGAGGSNYNFGELLPASLAGFVYVDANLNGAKDPGEPGLAGVSVVLSGTSDLGAVNLTTVTGGDGSYLFRNLRPGTYTLVETEPAGYFRGRNAVGSVGGSVGSDRISSIGLAMGVAGVNYNFAELWPSSLSGFVYFDPNNSGARDAGKPGIAGVTTTLTGTTDLGTAINLSQNTGADGSYSFAGLRPGTYVITETPPANYTPGKNSLGTAGGVVGTNQFTNITIGTGVRGVEYDFAELLSGPTGVIFADSFGPNNSVFQRPQDQTILTKLQLLSSGGQLDPNLLTQATYVDGLYRTILGRPADVAGLTIWVQQLVNGVSRVQVVNSIWTSAEHRGLQVDRYYVTFLHRSADAAGRSAWVNSMLNGASEIDVARMFLASGEYRASHADDASYINGLYADILGRRPSTGETAGWVRTLQGGASRDDVATAFLTSAENYQLILNCDYTHFLLRPPDAAGNSMWLSQLVSGRVTPAAVCEAFLASDEFFGRARQAATS
jgi:protocatechuate 3,4-dioxygenase beta subunit